MKINKSEVTIKPIRDEYIPLFDKWLDKEYIRKWFGEKEDWLNEISERNGKCNFQKHYVAYKALGKSPTIIIHERGGPVGFNDWSSTTYQNNNW